MIADPAFGLSRIAGARLLALILLVAATCRPALAGEPVVWSLEGRGGQVLLIGSVHLLRQQDYPLPDNIMQAYRSADRLVMELDIDDIDPLQSQMLLLEMGRLPAGRTLADVMGARDFRRAGKYASELGYPLEMFASLKPWFAALTIMNLHTMSAGYSPELGLEQHLTGLALRDGKDVDGLETMAFQLELFDGLGEHTQSQLFLQTLQEASIMDEQLDKLIHSWREGDVKALDQELRRSFSDYPEVYRRLVSDRNREWAGQLVKLSNDDGITMVVVGALHLVGKDSVIEMLRNRRYKVRQWQPAE